MPEVGKSYFEENGQNIAAAVQELYSLQDGFLEKSKASFGEPIREDPSYEGIPFVLPFLEARHFLEASAEERARWFEVFDGYMIESMKDAGVLMAFKDPAFDDVIYAVLQAMQSEGVLWPIEG